VTGTHWVDPLSCRGRKEVLGTLVIVVNHQGRIWSFVSSLLKETVARFLVQILNLHRCPDRGWIHVVE